MGDVAEKRVGGRIYRVYGLQAKAASIRAAAANVSDSITATLGAARTAMASWQGPHADVFAERINAALASMVTLQLAGESAAARCSWFPAEPGTTSMLADYAYRGARVYPPGQDGSVGADPDALHDFARTTGDQGGSFNGLAAAVDVDGLWAEVVVQRALTYSEREVWRERGVPPFEIDSARVWADPQPVPIGEVFGLPDLGGQASLVAAAADELAAWTAAVAYALENADRALIDLLMKYPELAGYLDRASLTEGRMTSEAALLVVLANLARFDTAGGRGDVDGVVGLSDLEAIANDASAPAHVRAAAQHLLDNRLFLSMASIIDQPISYEVFPEDVRLTADGIAVFLEYNAAVRAVGIGFDRLDTAAEGGDGDGFVSPEDLAAAAEGDGFPAALRDAAAFLLANPLLTQRLGLYDRANLDRATANFYGELALQGAEPMGFTRDGVIALAIDQQAFASDPAAARQFVLGLPMADRQGDGGLSIFLVSDEGLKALANAALLDVRGDLSGQHAVISHLPETTSWGFEAGAVTQHGGVRNTLINGFYDLMAKRADVLFAGPELAGRPRLPGHPGANWLMFAPWASDTVGGVITGETTGPIGFTTSGIQQAAADGNQWIFNDIGARYSAFIELYEQSPVPSEAQLERFFATTFDDGDGTIRTGFAAYVAAIEETDPVQAQRLLFQGNTLVATHEQAGVQPYLERVSLGPDNIAAHFVDARVGTDVLHMNEDLPAGPTANNHVMTAPILSLDTGGAAADDFVGQTTRFHTGGGSSVGVVDLDPIAGIESFQPGFSDSTTTWVLEGGGDADNPESLAGSGASSWPDWEERMHAVLRLFEQNHTAPALFDTDVIEVSLDRVVWLDPEARPE